MTYTEIKDLLSSGFTPEQITQLTTSGDLPSSPDPETGADPITATVSLESPAEVGEGTPLPSPTEGTPLPSPTEGEHDDQPDPLEDIRQQLQQLQQENKQLKEQIQTNNIRDRTVPTVAAPDVAATLAEIIRPTFNK